MIGSTVAVQVMDGKGIIRFANDEAVERAALIGIDPIVGQSVFDLVSHEWRSQIEEMLARAASSEPHIADLRVEISSSDGSVRSAVISHVRAESGGTGHLVMTELIKHESEQSTPVQPLPLALRISRVMSDAVWMGSPDMTEIEHVNEALEKLWGHAAADIYASSEILIDGVHPDDRDRFVAIIRDNPSGEWVIECRVVRPDGSERAIEARAFEVVKSSDGTYKRAGICRDITDQVRGVTRSRENEKFAARVDQLAGVVGWEIDTHTDNVIWTDALADLLEVPRENLAQRNDHFDDYIHPADREFMKVARDRSLQSADISDVEFRLRTERGKELHIRSIGVSDVVDGKEIRRWGYLQDITEHKDLALRSERTEEISSSVRELARIAGWELDFTTARIRWTGEFFDMLEIPRGEAPSMEDLISDYVYSADQDELRTAIDRALSTGEPYDLKLRLTTATGSTKWIRAIGRPELEHGEVVRLWGYLQDQTFQTRTEGQLADIKEMLSETGRLARIGGWELDAETSVKVWSDGIYDIFDIPLGEEPPPDGAIELYHPDDQPKVRAAHLMALDVGQDYDLNVRIITDKGALKHVRLIGHPIVVDGRTTKVRGALQDITDEVESQAVIADRERLLAETGRTARIGGWELDAESLKVSWTDVLFDIFEIPMGEQPPLDGAIGLYHPDDQPMIRAAVENGLENGEAFDLKLRVITAKGRAIFVRALGRALIVDGKTAKLWGSLQDITDEAESQAELARSEDLLAATGRAARIGAWELDAATMEVVWADTLFDIYEMPKGEKAQLFGAIDLYHPDDQPKLRAAIESGLEKGEAFDLELRITTASGSSKVVRALGRPMIEGGKTVRLRGSLQDVTDQVESQAALEASQMLLAATGRAARVGGWELDAATMEVRWTDSLLDLFEVSDRGKPELFGLIDFYHPDDQPVLRAAVQSGLDDGDSFDLQLRVITAKGRVIVVRALGNPAIENGKTVRLWGSIQDVTDQVESLAALAASEMLLAETGRTARIGGWDLDAETLKVSWTDVLFDIFEIPLGEPKLFGAIDIYHPDDQPIIRAAVANGLENGESFDLELRLITGKGTLRTVRVWGRPAIEGGKTVRMWGSVQDITARALGEAALAKSENRMRTILDTAPDSFILLDKNGVVELWNESSEKMFGFTAEEALGRRLSTLIIPEGFRSAHDEGIDRLSTTGEGLVFGTTLELFAVRSDGSEFPIELIVKKIDEGGHLHMLGCVRDVTERVEHASKVRHVFSETITAMNNTIKVGDPYTADHQRRVAQLSFAMAEKLGYSVERATGVQFGAMIHDIGRVSVPVDILNKPGPLSSIEFEMVKGHAEVGQKIISEISYPWPVADIIGQHHERLDGSGYPNGLRGEEISEEARIVAVADVVEAMSSHRPFRAALGIEAALAEIFNNRGTLYDADVVDACLALFRDHQFEFDSV